MTQRNQVDIECNNLSLKNWMSNLPQQKQRVPIIFLAIPGSHNTFSYSISPNADVSPDSPQIVQKLSRWAKFIVNRFIYKWSLTQTVPIRQQLDLGIRYLDIRVVSHKSEFYVAHGLYGGLLEPYLVEINKFLTEASGEVVILDFQHFYEFSDQDHQKLIDSLKSIFGDKLCKKRNLLNVSLDAMAVHGEQVFVIYRSSAGKKYSVVWPSGVWPNPWPNTSKVDDLLSYLDDELKVTRGNRGLVTQCLLTIDTCYVVKHPFSSLKKIATKANRSVIPWINKQSTRSNGINIVICDFVNLLNFIKTVVDLNFKNKF